MPIEVSPNPGLGCVIVRKIDDQGVGLPDWEIHGRPVGQMTPHLDGHTDGTGYIRFDNLQPGKWNFWEIVQHGWEPVTAEMVETEVTDGPACAKVIFINRQTPFCVEGQKIDDDHVPLPNWEIHALSTSGWPHRVTHTDANGYFRFDNLTNGEWRFWEIMQSGWEPVTSETFTIDPNTHPNPPPAGQCYQIRFKNRQVLPPTTTPTPTVTPTPASNTPIPPQNPIYLPLIVKPGGMCEVGRLQVNVWGTFYSFPLTPDGNVKLIEPLDWQSPTEFKIVLYEGPVKWTQYKPTYFKQEGGYTFTYPGDRAGEDFLLFVDTDCGVIGIETAIDDPTPTPVAGPN